MSSRGRQTRPKRRAPPAKRTKRNDDAREILERVIGKDRRLRREVAKATLNVRIAEMIHATRTGAGMTQAELARLVGTTQSVISRLEDGDYKGHSLAMLQRIAAALYKRVEVRFVPEVA